VTPFAEVSLRRGPEAIRAYREICLCQSDELLCEVFQGRVPSPAEKLAWADRTAQLMIPDRAFRNDTYEVLMNLGRPFIHLDIRRHDGGAATNWRDLQQIKNELIGTEHEAVELFPAEGRLVDAGNQYHLWVYADPVTRFPLGWWQRCVPPSPGLSPVGQPGFDTAAGNSRVGITLKCGSVAIPNLVLGPRKG
jgi:hypothetical protein